MDVETFFLVAVTSDGGFVTYSEMPQEPINAERQATTADIYSVAQQIVREVDQQLLADRITASVLNALAPQVEPTLSDKLKEALKERGIDPESVTPTN